MRGILEPDHLLLILLVVLVLFGGKKIPELAGGLGKGIKEFKRGMADLSDPSTPELPASDVRPQAASSASPAAAERAPKRLIG